MKQNIITLDCILEYYDVPQLFLGRDGFDTQYLCLLYEDTPLCQYTAIRISTQLFARFLKGQVDLRSLFVHPESEGEYFDVTFTGEEYAAQPAAFTDIPEERLPEEGFVMDGGEIDTVTINVPKRERNLFDRLMQRHGWVAI